MSGTDLTGIGEPQRISTTFVSPGFWNTLGVAPEVGPRSARRRDGARRERQARRAQPRFLAAPVRRSDIGHRTARHARRRIVRDRRRDAAELPLSGARGPDVHPVFDDPGSVDSAHSPGANHERRRADEARRHRRAGERGDERDHARTRRRVSRTIGIWEPHRSLRCATRSSERCEPALFVLLGAVGFVLIIAAVNLAEPAARARHRARARAGDSCRARRGSRASRATTVHREHGPRADRRPSRRRRRRRGKGRASSSGSRPVAARRRGRSRLSRGAVHGGAHDRHRRGVRPDSGDSRVVAGAAAIAARGIARQPRARRADCGTRWSSPKSRWRSSSSSARGS